MKKVTQFLSRWKLTIAWCVVVMVLVPLGGSIYRFVDYSLPMMRNDYNAAIQADFFGDKSLPHFNIGLSAYDVDHDYETARKSMERALSFCVGSDGQLMKSHMLLAAQCQFYIGNSYANSKKTAEAVAAYEECLKIFPGHLYAKYNLEKLQNTKPQSPQGGKGGSPGRKI